MTLPDSEVPGMTKHEILNVDLFLGSVEAQRITPGYGAAEVFIDNFGNILPRLLITNDVGDVRLLIDDTLRPFSSLELRRVRIDLDGIFSRQDQLPEEYRTIFNNTQPFTTLITKGKSTTEIFSASGDGYSTEDPVIMDPTLLDNGVHIEIIPIALIREAYLTKRVLYLVFNKVLFTFTPNENHVNITATFSFPIPRPLETIQNAIDSGKGISHIDDCYYNYMMSGPQPPLSREEWIQQYDKASTVDLATIMFENIQKRILEEESADKD